MKAFAQLKELIKTGEFAVFVSGLVGLGLQILAGRLLAPAFGSSVYTWGSIIGVFMVTLSLGYAFGGKYAKNAKKQDAVLILLISGLFVAFLAHFGTPLATFFGSLPIPSQYAALPAVLILFGPPSFLFGLLTPYAVTLSAKAHKGEASGRVFTLDTVGSIFGSFGATFLLIPLFTLTMSFVILGVIALLGVIIVLPKPKYLVFASIIFVLLLLSLPLSSSVFNDSLNVTKESPYQRLQVIDKGDVRYLYSEGTPQSAMDLSDPDSLFFMYTRYFQIPLLLDTPEDVLFIGGGGFSVPKQFSSLGFNVDVVELDPVVVDFAKEYFLVDNYPMNIIVGDGRTYLQKTDKKYDIIFVDAYKQYRVPFHLTTQEFYQEVYEHLDEDGTVFVNIISTPGGEGSKFFRSELKTIGSVFPSMYSFTMYRTNQVQNIMLMGSKLSPLSYSTLVKRDKTKELGLEPYIKNMIVEIPLDDVAILTDEKAPVDTLLTAIADLPLDLVAAE